MESDKKAVFDELLTNLEDTSLKLEESTEVLEKHKKQQLLKDQRNEVIIKKEKKRFELKDIKSLIKNNESFFKDHFKNINNFIKEKNNLKNKVKDVIASKAKTNDNLKNEVKTLLSTKEQGRLRNIGHFFTEGAFKVVEGFIKKRDKEESMNTANKKNSKGFFQRVGGAFKAVKNVAQSGWFKKLLFGVGVLYLLSILMRDKIVDFFSNLWSNVKPMFEGIVDGIKRIFEKMTRCFQ